MGTVNYAVIFCYSFDDDVALYVFNTEEEAKKFLKESYEEELRIEVEENKFYAEGYFRDDGLYTTITVNHDDVTEMRIGKIYQ